MKHQENLRIRCFLRYSMCCIGVITDIHHEKIVEEDRTTSILLQIHNRTELFDMQCIS